jgi:hypothetical protein
MLIRHVRATGLRGTNPQGCRSNELGPDGSVPTLIALQTDGGLVGIGSCFTTEARPPHKRPALDRLLIEFTASGETIK